MRLRCGNFISQRRYFSAIQNVFENVNRELVGNAVLDMETHMKKLVETNHRVLQTLRCIPENKHLKYGKIVNQYAEVANADKKVEQSARAEQVTIAKVLYMAEISSALHQDVEIINEDNKHLHRGNKIAILCGDYLLSKCFVDLAAIKDQFYLEQLSSGCRDVVLGQTIGLKDKHYDSLPSKPTNFGDVSTLDEFTTQPTLYPSSLGNPIGEWMMRSTLNGGSLLGKSCLSVLRIGNHPESIQNIGISFGKYYVMALKASEDLKDILGNRRFQMVNLAVYLQLKNDPRFYARIEENKDDLRGLDFEGLREEILRSGVVEEAKLMRRGFVKSAIDSLEYFKDSDAKCALLDSIRSLES